MMNKPGLLLAAAFIIIFFFGCSPKNNPKGIEGVWISTEETSTDLGDADNIVMLVTRDTSGNMAAQSCYIKDGRFKMAWKFAETEYDSASKQLTVLDTDSDTLRCSPDSGYTKLKGVAYLSDEAKTKVPLNFIRTEKDFTDLFYPRLTGKNGRIVYTYNQPAQTGDGLQTASLFEYVNDTSAFYGVMDRIIAQKFGRVESILIVKEGKLLLEEYFFGFGRNTLHRINSCTKSITSLLLGISLYRHNKTGVNRPVFDFFPRYDSLETPEKEKITLAFVMTMTAGFQEEDDFEGYGRDELLHYILGSPMASAPGEKFRYSGKCSNLLCCIIYTLENKEPDKFAEEVLFGKLGITEFEWEPDNGIIPCDQGLKMYPRDMAKIGMLALNNGMWNGEQVVPAEWIKISTKPYVPETEFFDYGYQWWYRSERNTPWWDNPVRGGKTEHDMFLALGAGGQYIMVIRDLDMVIVTTASDYNRDGMSHQKIPLVIEEIVPLFEKLEL